jgi:SNF2 family DNA or RNA helicase
MHHLQNEDASSLDEIWRSPKFIALVHIVTMAVMLGEKTLVFSKCLKTLDKIESVFALPNWKEAIKRMQKYFPACNEKIGGWKKNQQYLRIDGGTDPGRRGELIDKFSRNSDHHVFLISSEAGGLGINLVRGFCFSNTLIHRSAETHCPYNL